MNTKTLITASMASLLAFSTMLLPAHSRIFASNYDGPFLTVSGTPSPDGRLGRAGDEVVAIDGIPEFAVPTQDAVCPATEDGSPATVEEMIAFEVDNGIAYVQMKLGDFANDPDVLAAIGPAPDDMLNYTIIFANPLIETEFTVIYVMVYDDAGCYAGYLPFDPGLVVAGMDGE